MRVSDITGRRRIDLNVDIGEGFAFDKDLLKFASSANICCGEHAGSLDLTRETIALCKHRRVRIGAHPGYPDRPTMGRRPMEVANQREWLNSIFRQVAEFVKLLRPAYIKPHGAFYSDTAVALPDDWAAGLELLDKDAAYEAGGLYLAQYPGLQSLILLLRIHKLPLMGLEATAHSVIAGRAGQNLVREGFADRAYLPTGQLVPRGEPGAVYEDAGQVRAQTQLLIRQVDSICLHGDGDHCVEFAELVYQTVKDAGYEVGF
jgi:UPF0271 protein